MLCCGRLLFMERWIDSVERTTERYLTWRKRRHLARQAKQAKKKCYSRLDRGLFMGRHGCLVD